MSDVSTSPPPTVKKKRCKCPGWFEWLKFGLEFVGIVGLGIYCIYTYKEWVTFDSERKTMENEYAEGKANSEKQMTMMQRQIDDSEAQQRAILQFGEFKFKKAHLGTNYLGYERVRIDWSFDLKNVGFSPAVDLQGYGLSFFEGGKWNDYTNAPHKWNHSTIPTPNPYGGKVPTSWILPQQTITNDDATLVTELFPGTEDFYFETWYSYRDIFWHSWIVGEGGHFTLTNDTFTPDFIYNGKFRESDETNSIHQ